MERDDPVGKAYAVTDDIRSLRYWQAIVAFGHEAVENELAEPRWCEKHPEIVEALASSDEQAKRGILLPGDIVFEIAGREECAEDFYADPDGKRLYAVEREWRDRSGPESRGHVLIPNQEALLTYGAFCLFRASDKGIGYKGEQDTLRGR
jgi:hypothetical protein